MSRSTTPPSAAQSLARANNEVWRLRSRGRQRRVVPALCVQRGTHILKLLSIGAWAVGIGRHYLFPLAVGGEEGVELALELLRAEIERGMKLMGCAKMSQLSRANLRFR
jgi:hypothetical protein